QRTPTTNRAMTPRSLRSSVVTRTGSPAAGVVDSQLNNSTVDPVRLGGRSDPKHLWGRHRRPRRSCLSRRAVAESPEGPEQSEERAAWRPRAAGGPAASVGYEPPRAATGPSRHPLNPEESPSSALKVGTRVKNIRLIVGGHNID